MILMVLFIVFWVLGLVFWSWPGAPWAGWGTWSAHIFYMLMFAILGLAVFDGLHRVALP